MGNKRVAEIGVFQDFYCQHRPDCGEGLDLLQKTESLQRGFDQTLTGQISAMC